MTLPVRNSQNITWIHTGHGGVVKNSKSMTSTFNYGT